MCSLIDGFSFAASRVSARRPTHFLLLRQEKVSKEKATRVRVSLRCASGNLRCSQLAGSLQTRFAQTCVPLFPPVAALLGTRTREWGRNTNTNTNSQLRSLAFGIANSRNSQQPLPHHHASASAATRDTTHPACKVSASERARGSRPLTPPPLGRAEQRSVGRIRAGACLSAASLRPPPPNASSAGYPAGARSPARLSFAYFSLAKQRKVSRPPGRNPACHANTNTIQKPKC